MKHNRNLSVIEIPQCIIDFMKTLWRLWASALGAKTGKNDVEANIVAIIRTLIAWVYLITNIIICMGVWKHWND